MLSQLVAGGIKCILCESSGKGLLEAYSWFPISPHAPCPFTNFALYPFPVINHSHEYDNMLSPVNPPSKLPNLGVVLGTLNTA